MVKAKKWVLVRHFEGMAKESDLELQEEELPPLKDGQALFEAQYLSVDPYMRIYTAAAPLGSTMIGEQVAKVIESRNPKFKVGDYYAAYFGWRTHTVSDGVPAADNALNVPVNLAVKIPDLGNLPISLGLGTIGMPGATAYLAMKEIGNPKPGETVFVNGAAGAVGHIVGQIAKIRGCTVLGSAGTDEKCSILKSDFGFDKTLNYKTSKDLNQSIKELAPNGIDIYFDQVGGDLTDIIVPGHMRQKGRVVIIGHISKYNEAEMPKVPNPYLPVLINELRVEGFVIFRREREVWDQGFVEMIQWLHQGKLKYKEHITEGFANAPQAFLGLFKGENIGKAVVRV